MASARAATSRNGTASAEASGKYDGVGDGSWRGNAFARGDRANVHFKRNAGLLVLLRALEWHLYTGETGQAALDAAAAAWPVDVQDAAAGVYAPCVRAHAPSVGTYPAHVRIAALVAAPNGRPLPPSTLCTRLPPSGTPHALHSYHPLFLETVEVVADALARHIRPS